MDTDNADNFLSKKSFNMFHKQRDYFYEIFQEWDISPKSEYYYNKKFKVKIDKLFTFHNDMSSYYHFARLFKSQLLISCLSNDQQVSFALKSVHYTEF